jgi:hypothetical protein
MRILEPLFAHTHLAALLTEFGRRLGNKERISSGAHGENVLEVAVGATHGKVESVEGHGLGFFYLQKITLRSRPGDSPLVGNNARTDPRGRAGCSDRLTLLNVGCPGAITVILAILYRNLPILERSWEE